MGWEKPIILVDMPESQMKINFHRTKTALFLLIFLNQTDKAHFRVF